MSPVRDARRKLAQSLLTHAGLLVVCLLLLFAWDRSGLDLAVSRPWATIQGFGWRDHWLTDSVLHSGARALAWLALGALVASLWCPVPVLRHLGRDDKIWWLCTMLLCLLAVAAMKRFSSTSCPWSLTEFGGSVPYVPHWMMGRSDDGPGHCFPSGHVSTALAFLPGAFVLGTISRTSSRIYLAVVLAFGVLLAGAQVARGAHFISHALWTAWVCWLVTAVSFQAYRALQRRHRMRAWLRRFVRGAQRRADFLHGSRVVRAASRK